MKKLVLSLSMAIAFGAVIFAGTAQGQPQPPPPPGGGPTATPLPTATPIPLTLRVSLSHTTIRAGQTQTVTVTALPGAVVSLSVTYPNSSRKAIVVLAAAGSAGTMTTSFVQPAGATTRSSHKAKVSVRASTADGQSKSSTKRYTIK